MELHVSTTVLQQNAASHVLNHAHKNSMKHCRILPRLPLAGTLLKRRQRMQLRQMQIFPLACEDQRRTKGQCQRAASICIVWPL